MFQNCISFNQPIAFDTASVTNMSSMFSECIHFNQMVDLDTSNVVDMAHMFDTCLALNEKLDFDTSNVQNMNYMFNECRNFNQNISGWDVSNVVQHTGIFRSCGIENIFKPLFKRENESQAEYNNGLEEHLNIATTAKKQNLSDQRLNSLKVKYALPMHYPPVNAIPKQPKNVEKVFANNMFMRNILSNLGDGNFSPTSNKHKFSKTRKRMRGG
jgi:surface protein